jgi:ribosomal protein S18 acetylase RimI-like enzyme
MMAHFANDSRFRAVWARVYLKNVPAIAFWTRRGFRKIVEHNGRFVHTENAHTNVILERSLR